MLSGLARLVAILIAVCALVAAPSAAYASGLPQHAPTSNCPKPLPYPIPPNATIAASATVVTAGETIEVAGNGYCPDEDIVITIAGKNVATTHSDAKGGFDPPVVVPDTTGSLQLCGRGETDLARNADCLTLTSRGAGAGASNSPGAGGGATDNGGDTAVTGTQIALLTAVALLLVAGGVAFATAGHTRKRTA